MKTKYAFAILLTLMFNQAMTQVASTFNATGNSYSRGNVNFEWSVGELALIHSMESSGGEVMITNGLLQPKILLASGNTNFNFSYDEIRIFPNPTPNKVEINFLTNQQGIMKVDVIDVTGKIMLSRKVINYGIGNIEVFDLTTFAPATYFFRIDLIPAYGSVPKKGLYKIVKN
ncbi:MAG: T9SS type A sorting domain-containing protein [Chitinophagaceae bacterium]